MTINPQAHETVLWTQVGNSCGYHLVQARFSCLTILLLPQASRSVWSVSTLVACLEPIFVTLFLHLHCLPFASARHFAGASKHLVDFFGVAIDFPNRRGWRYVWPKKGQKSAKQRFQPQPSHARFIVVPAHDGHIRRFV